MEKEKLLGSLLKSTIVKFPQRLRERGGVKLAELRYALASSPYPGSLKQTTELVRLNFWIRLEAGFSRFEEHLVFPAIERAPLSSRNQQRLACSWHVEMLHLLEQLTAAASNREKWVNGKEEIENNSDSTLIPQGVVVLQLVLSNVQVSFQKYLFKIPKSLIYFFIFTVYADPFHLPEYQIARLQYSEDATSKFHLCENLKSKTVEA